MAEVPEHLLQAQSAERRKALGLPVAGEEGDDDRDRGRAGRRRAGAERRRGRGRGARGGRAPTPATDHARPRAARKIPAHLLERSKQRKAALRRRRRRCTRGRGAGARRRHRDRGRRRPRRAVTGPGRSHAAPAHRRQVGFDPADARPRRRTRCTSGRTCSSIEFASILSCSPRVTIFSALVQGAAARRSPTSTRRRTRRRRRGTSWVCRSCSRCSTRWSRA